MREGETEGKPVPPFPPPARASFTQKCPDATKKVRISAEGFTSPHHVLAQLRAGIGDRLPTRAVADRNVVELGHGVRGGADLSLPPCPACRRTRSRECRMKMLKLVELYL